MYDSREDTLKHIDTVRKFLGHIILELEQRALLHDSSKLEDPEKRVYDEYTPLLKGLAYGSDEYKKTIEKMGYGVRHHYKHNSHHPEHYENGIGGMSLLDVIEMLADWKAASQRHADGDIWESLEINRARFEIDKQLHQILKNTLRELNW